MKHDLTAVLLSLWYNDFHMKRTPLAVQGRSETSIVKREIQDVVRETVIKRDGGCIFQNLINSHWAFAYFADCNGYADDGHLILQADHLITRAKAATYADPRLIVCVCKGHHGWKKWHEREYNSIVRNLLSPERVKLWDECEQASWRPNREAAYNWPVTLAALKQELAQMP
jgi:hypothetical protein